MKKIDNDTGHLILLIIYLLLNLSNIMTKEPIYMHFSIIMIIGLSIRITYDFKKRLNRKKLNKNINQNQRRTIIDKIMEFILYSFLVYAVYCFVYTFVNKFIL